MQIVYRLRLALLAALMILAVGCGSSPQAPAPSTADSTAISEAEAIAKAEAVAVDRGLSVDGLDISAGLLFGEWQVSFEPPGTDELRGGFLVVLDAESGEPIDVVTYQ